MPNWWEQHEPPRTPDYIGDAWNKFLQRPNLENIAGLPGSVIQAGLSRLPQGIQKGARDVLALTSLPVQAVEGAGGYLSQSISRPDPAIRALNRLSPVGWLMDDPIGTIDDAINGLIDGNAPQLLAKRISAPAQASLDSRAREWVSKLPEDYSAKYRRHRLQGNDLNRILGGDDPATYALQMSANVAFSGDEAQMQAIERMTTGESQDVVLRGLSGPGRSSSAEEKSRFKMAAQEYWTASGRIARLKALQAGQGEKAAQLAESKAIVDAKRFVAERNYIPGVENPGREFLGQTVLGIGLGKAGLDPISPKARAARAAEQAAQVGETLPVVPKKGLFNLTPLAEASLTRQAADDMVAVLTRDSTNARDVLRRFVNDPAGLVEEYGNVPLSVKASRARPAVAIALDSLPENATLDQIRAALTKASKQTIGGLPDPTRFDKVVNAQKAVMGEAYLRSPGYIVRNAVSDSGQMLIDGVMNGESLTNIKDTMKRARLPILTDAETMLGSNPSLLTKVPGIGKWQNWLGEIGQKAENSRRLRAYYSAFQEFRDSDWNPQLSNDVRAALGEETAANIERGLKHALNKDEIRRIGTGNFYFEPTSELSLPTQQTILEGVNRATSPAAKMSVLDKVRAKIETTGAAFARKGQLDAVDDIAKQLDAHLAGKPKLSNGAMAALRKDLKRIEVEQNEWLAKAQTYANERVNFSLLDYSQRRNIDRYIQAVAPFSYWSTRQGKNYLLRAVNNPQLVATYVRYQDMIEKQNRERGLPNRFKGGINVPGTNLYVDPTNLLMPFADVITVGQGEELSPAQAAYSAMQDIGLRPSPPIDIALRASNALVAKEGDESFWGRESVNNVLPQTNLLQAATAAAGIGGPAGVNVETPLRKAIGLPEAAGSEAYRAQRSIRDMATERDIGKEELPAYLLAQLLIQESAERDWNHLLTQMQPDEVSKTYGVSPEEAARALEIAREGAKRSTLQAGLGSVGSYIGVPRLKELPEGERQYGENARLKRGAIANEFTSTGSRAEMDAMVNETPSLETGSTNKEAALYAARARVKQGEYDEAILADPADKKLVPDNRAAKVEDVYKPRSNYGMSPAETLALRQSEVISYLLTTKPRRADFDEVQAYKDALGEWEAELDANAKKLPQFKDIAAQAATDGLGDEFKAWAITDRDIASYYRRNDSPVEALQRAYFDQVYANTVDEFERLTEAGDPQAYEKTIGSVPAITGKQLASLVEPGRYAPGELEAAAEKLSMPSLEDVWRKNASKSQVERVDAKREFEALAYNSLPPDAEIDVDEISKALRYKKPTTEQYKEATAALKMWLEENPQQGNPAEWAQARRLASELQQQLATRFGEDAPDLLAKYRAATTAEAKRRLRLKNPKINDILAVESNFAQSQPLYSKYYRRGRRRTRRG